METDRGMIELASLSMVYSIGNDPGHQLREGNIPSRALAKYW
jgi:hypothetical protein